jgi:hypothetical protein
MKKPVTFYPDEEIQDKLSAKLDELGTSKDKYLSYLIEKDSEEYEEEDEEEEDETLSGVETLGSIEDITEKNEQIAYLEESKEILQKKLAEYEDDKALNQLFDVLEGHSFKIREDGKEYKIKSKADFVKCLVHNYYISFDPSEYGLTDAEFFEFEDDEL